MKRLAIIATFLLSILLTAFISSYFYEFRSRIRGLNYDSEMSHLELLTREYYDINQQVPADQATLEEWSKKNPRSDDPVKPSQKHHVLYLKINPDMAVFLNLQYGSLNSARFYDCKNKLRRSVESFPSGLVKDHGWQKQ